MKVFAMVLCLIWGNSYAALYGRDDRRERYEFSRHSLEYHYSNAVAMIVPFSKLQKNEEGVVLRFRTLGEESDIIEEKLCPEERFISQPASLSSVSTGFLVAPDILVTAGHVIDGEKKCDERAVVFGVSLSGSTGTLPAISQDNVYRCKKILRKVLSDKPLVDYSIVRLDRPVEGVAPLPLRKTGKIRTNAVVTMLGHPMGLPMKVTRGGVMLDNSHSSFFVSYLDTYPGNSGSPVIDPVTGYVEGVLVEGEAGDTTIRGEWPEGCWYSKVYCIPHLSQGQKCDSFELRGAKIIRSTIFANYISGALPR